MSKAEETILVSHYTHNRAINTSQRSLINALSQRFGVSELSIRVLIGGRQGRTLGFPSDEARENTQRTRSFMFLVLGAIVARRSGLHRIVCLAENGQMAIHLPLTGARIGAFSTHTAHPEFLAELGPLLAHVLDVPLKIENPFLYNTKAECIAGLVRQWPELVPQSVSCWRASRQAMAHCGVCIPCIVRRIAVESHGLKLKEYQRDLFTEEIANLDEDDSGRRNLTDVSEFVTRFGEGTSTAVIEETFPELISEYIDEAKAIDMYRRFSREAREVFAEYAGVSKLLG